MPVVDFHFWQADSIRRVKANVSPSIEEITSRIESRFPLIESMVQTISNGEVRVRLGKEWEYRFAAKTLICPPGELGYDEFRFSIAKVFHELGHWAIDRVVNDFFFLSQTRRLLANVVADPRVNNYQMSQYSGLGDNYMMPLYNEQWCKPYDEGAAFEQLGTLPHEQYAYGLIYRWVRDENNPAIKNEVVLDAIERSWQEYQKIINIYPRSKNATEEDILKQNEEIYRMTLENLWPIYQELIKESQKQVEQGLRDGSIQVGEGSGDGQAISDELISEEAKKIIEERSKKLNQSLEPAISNPESDNVEKLLKDANNRGETVDPTEGVKGSEGKNIGQGSDGGNSSQSSQGYSSDDSNSTGRYQTTEEQHPHYYSYLSRLSTVINQTVEYLRNVLQLSAYPSYESGFSSGKRINIKRWIQRDYTGRIDYFDRREVPEEPDYSFTLAIDQSTSMGGEKRSNALDTAVIFMEVLTRLDIDFNIIGFSTEIDDVIPTIPTLRIHKDFGSLPDIAERERIIQEIEELMARGGTDDYQAVQLALNKILNQAASKKVICVITDGAGNLQEEENISLLNVAEGRGVKVIGIGIGSGMNYVESVYKYYVSVGNISELPQALRDILVREIIGF